MLRSALRVLAIAMVVAAVAALAFPALLAQRSMGAMAFEPEPFDFALMAASMFAIAIGVQIVPFRSRRYITLLAIFASGFVLFGFLAVFSIGLALLPAGIVFLALLYRALRRDRGSRQSTKAALGGAAIGFALPLLFIAVNIPATVACSANGGSTSSRRWNPSSQFVSGGGGSANEPGVFTGYVQTDDSVATFRCEGGKLVLFERRPR